MRKVLLIIGVIAVFCLGSAAPTMPTAGHYSFISRTARHLDGGGVEVSTFVFDTASGAVHNTLVETDDEGVIKVTNFIYPLGSLPYISSRYSKGADVSDSKDI